ncbi:hypothetical protein K439DRAFT_1625356 [Ramaria rubella]|nr:hypothetical protein K439DRAFT_1625356 [Ramaria rubella]
MSVVPTGAIEVHVQIQVSYTFATMSQMELAIPPSAFRDLQTVPSPSSDPPPSPPCSPPPYSLVSWGNSSDLHESSADLDNIKWEVTLAFLERVVLCIPVGQYMCWGVAEAIQERIEYLVSSFDYNAGFTPFEFPSDGPNWVLYSMCVEVDIRRPQHRPKVTQGLQMYINARRSATSVCLLTFFPIDSKATTNPDIIAVTVQYQVSKIE